MYACCFKIKGVEEFKSYAQHQVDIATTKSAREKLAEKFQLKVALSRREQWENAVSEADSFLNKHAIERKFYFSNKLKSSNKVKTGVKCRQFKLFQNYLN